MFINNDKEPALSKRVNLLLVPTVDIDVIVTLGGFTFGMFMMVRIDITDLPLPRES